MRKAKNTIPVYDICSLGDADHTHEDVIAERFANYLKVHPNLHLAHGHSFYHLVLFTKGGGFHTIDFERFPVAPGQIYFMIPGQVHSWEFEGTMDGYVINFSEDFFHSFFADDHYLEHFDFLQGNAADGIVTLSKAAQQQAAMILERIIEEVSGKELLNKDMAKMLLGALFIVVARSQKRKSRQQDITKPGLLLLRNFRRLINQYYSQYKLPKEYAAMLYVTPNHLNALCRDLLGKPAGDVIRERVILEAKRQLINADIAISEIAYRLGFEDNSYFTKFFKKYTGITPEDFKRGLLTVS